MLDKSSRRIFTPGTILVMLLVTFIFYLYWTKFYNSLFDIPHLTSVTLDNNLTLNPNFEEEKDNKPEYWLTGDQVIYCDLCGVYQSRAVRIPPQQERGAILQQRLSGDFKQGYYRLSFEVYNYYPEDSIVISLSLRKGFFSWLRKSIIPDSSSHRQGWTLMKSLFFLPGDYSRIAIALTYLPKDTITLDNFLFSYLGKIEPSRDESPLRE